MKEAIRKLIAEWRRRPWQEHSQGWMADELEQLLASPDAWRPIDDDYESLLAARGSLFSQRQKFLRELHKIFIDRCSIPNATMTDCWMLYYKPGDYRKAAELAGLIPSLPPPPKEPEQRNQ